MKNLKLSFGRLLAILALVGWFSLESTAQEARFYQRASYQGKYLSYGEGDYDYGKFDKHFYYGGRKQTYCSVKIPRGYCLWVDYYGRGWEHSSVKKYTRSTSRLKVGWKKIRLRKCGYPGGGKPGGGGCRDWYVQFYKDKNYRGDYDCYKEGEHSYKFKWGGYPGSFKLKSGYILECYYRGRKVKTYEKGYSSFSGRYDKFVVRRHRGGGGGRPGGGGGCDNWYIQFYKDWNYRGDYHCYGSGEYGYRFDFDGRPRSFRLKRGYKVEFYRDGKLMKTYDGSASKYDGTYDRFKIVKYDGGGGGRYPGRRPGRGGDDDCDDWYAKFYSSSSYGGSSHCFKSGKHKFRFKFGYAKSFKIQRGYMVVCYYRGRKVKTYTGDVRSFRGRLRLLRSSTITGR